MSKNIDIKFTDGSKIYFTSDQHLNHENVIKFCHRPFNNIEEMNETLIKKWNDKVPRDAIVFHLGDFAWGGFQAWEKHLSRLNGEIVLIVGNHDIKNLTTTAKTYFKYVTQQMKIEVENRKVYLNHFPMLCYGGTYRDKDSLEWQLHGHVHLTRETKKNTGKDHERCINSLFPTQYDVGVDFNNFEPISWAEVNANILTQVENNQNIKLWIKDE